MNERIGLPSPILYVDSEIDSFSAIMRIPRFRVFLNIGRESQVKLDYFDGIFPFFDIRDLCNPKGSSCASSETVLFAEKKNPDFCQSRASFRSCELHAFAVLSSGSFCNNKLTMALCAMKHRQNGERVMVGISHGGGIIRREDNHNCQAGPWRGIALRSGEKLVFFWFAF